VSGSAAAPGTWGACGFCGVAVAAGASRCPICGTDRPLSASEVRTAPRVVRRRLFATGAFRSVIVVVVIAALAYALIAAVLAGPPVVADPLTTSGTYFLPAGAHTVISGEITGGDYVVGNFTSLRPAGASVGVAVYNSSEWAVFTDGGAAVPAYSLGPSASSEIVYSAPYTDTFYFVLSNPYPVSSGLNVSVYVATQYESNVGDDGFS
jgi:hypothetical protein